jgi:4,5:9,10-diseco-3-hydroxy-5,9,17-trioxoandrosta-1(10),2-diene-4-oate hydrolase
VQWLGKYLVNDPASIDDTWASYVVEVCKMPGGTRVLWQGHGQLVKPFPREALRSIKQPTLVVWGKDNHFIPVEHGEGAVHDIPDARLEVIDGAGHLPFLEKGPEFNEIVTRFLTEAPS